MNQCGLVGFDEVAFQRIGKFQQLGLQLARQLTGLARYADHVEQTLLAKKGNPRLAGRIGLMQRSDQRILLQPVCWRGDSVAARQQNAQMAQALVVQPAFASDMLHQQQVLRFVDYGGNR